jgi:FKBP-type peptidyl-prolyl cis-trans isomerase 2
MKRFQSSLLLAIVGMAVTLALPGGGTPSRAAETAAPPENAIKATVSDYDQLQKVIGRAIKEAEARGDKEVNIHLVEDPHLIQPADLVTVDYTVFDPEGRVVYTTRPEQFSHMDARYHAFFGQAGKATGPETVLAGIAGLFPGSGQAVLGLHANETGTVMVPPEKGFGPRDERKIETYPRQRMLPRTASLPVSAFLKTFDSAPETGKVVTLSPYFPSRVTGVKDGVVEMENVVENGFKTKDAFGTTTFSVADEKIVISLDPVIGAPFDFDEKKGVITKKDQTSFHVDYNHPLAGQELKFDVHVLGLQKFSVFETVDIPWIEDHDTAMDRAVREEKPLVLVLYADWCQWSQRLLNATFADPRIKRFHDRFVWLKIDSDKERVFKEVFEQENFPMIVLMDSSGEIVERMGGFQDGGTLSLELDRLLAGKIDPKTAARAAAGHSRSSAPHCKSEE